MTKESGSRIQPGTTHMRKDPRWVTCFLRALERTGTVRVAAEDAGIDHSTAYARRRTHVEFAGRWEEALARHEETKAEAEREELEALKWAPTTPAFGGGPPPRSGEELIIANGQVKRAGHGRWGKAKEKIFFDELAATANARMAAAAVGLTKNAVLQRRLRHPLFAAKWDAVARMARASIGLYAIEATNKTFDPEALDTGETTPKVTIDQAIKISQIDASTARRDAAPNPFEEEAAAASPEEADRLREKLVGKLLRLQDRMRREDLAKGWTLDEGTDALIPPGWVKQSGA